MEYNKPIVEIIFLPNEDVVLTSSYKTDGIYNTDDPWGDF